MIYGLEVNDPKVIDRFADGWNNPTGIITRLLLNTYLSTKIYKLDEYMIIDQENYLDIVARFVVLTTLGALFVGILIQSPLMIWILVTPLVVSMAFISPKFRAFLICLRIKIKYPKLKVRVLSDQKIKHKLLLTGVKGGAIRSF